MTEKYSYAGQFTFDKVKLFSSSGTVVDISRIVSAVNLFEDLYKSCMTGDITIVDTNNIIMEAPVIGQEFLGFKLITPGLDDFALDYSTHVFTITKVVSRTSPRPGVMVYQLHFSSPEGLRDNRVRVSKSYTNSIDAIVEDVLSSAKYINTKKTLFLEETKGIKKTVVPYVHPFKLINQLKVDAISKKHNSPHYMFYENTLGIHFRTLDSMYAQKAIQSFNAGDMGGKASLQEELERVIDFQVVGNNDMLLNIVTGMLASNVITHDIYRKEYKYDDFEYIADFDNNNRINYDENNHPIYNDVPIDEFDNTISMFTDAKRYIHPTSTIINNSDAQHYDTGTKSYPYTANNIAKTIMSRKSKLAELTQGMSIIVQVNGSTTYNVGAMVNFTAPVTGAKHSGEDNDLYLTGRYLIKSLRHMFDFQDKRHTCAMTLVRDSINNELPMNDLAIEPKNESSGVISEFYS